MPSSRPRWLTALLILGALFLLIQVVPYGRAHVNPPVMQEPKWDSTATRDLAHTACYDCHSNETHWPAYASVAPISWLVQSDVQSGRAHLNFSEWQDPQHHADDAADEVRKGDMPQWNYTLLHAAARLSAADRTRLAEGLEKTVAVDPPGQ